MLSTGLVDEFGNEEVGLLSCIKFLLIYYFNKILLRALLDSIDTSSTCTGRNPMNKLIVSYWSTYYQKFLSILSNKEELTYSLQSNISTLFWNKINQNNLININPNMNAHRAIINMNNRVKKERLLDTINFWILDLLYFTKWILPSYCLSNFFIISLSLFKWLFMF